MYPAMRLCFLTMLATAVAFAPITTRAANLVTYPFNKGTLSPTLQDGVTASGFGSSGSNADVTIGVSNGSYAYIQITQSSINVSQSVSNQQFATFSVTAPANNGMELSQIQFNAARGADSTPRSMALRWSFDNYASNLGVVSITSTWPNTKNYMVRVNAFVGGSVTFRLYAFTDEVSPVDSSIRFGHIVVTGAPVIYAPVVTPASPFVQTIKSSYVIKGTAYSAEGIARVEVALSNPDAGYSGANGATLWNYHAINLHYGTSTYYVRAIDKKGKVGSPVRVSIKRIRTL
jgi:hypothetical protein